MKAPMVFMDQTVAVLTALVVVRVQGGQTPRLFDPLLEAMHFGVEDALANLCLARHLQHKIVGTEHLLALARSKAIVLALRPRVQLGWSQETLRVHVPKSFILWARCTYI